MLKKPYLASYVRSFALRGGNEFCNDIANTRSETKGKNDEVEEVAEVFRVAVETSTQYLKERSGRMPELDEGKTDGALLALLLPALVKLERLDLKLSHPRHFYVEMMEKAAARETPFETQQPFLNLSEITNFWYNNNKKYDRSLDLLVAYLQLPSVHVFYGYEFGSANDGPNKALAALKPSSSSLTHLELKMCTMNSQDVANVVRACKALSTFVLEKLWDNIPFNSFNTARVRKALTSAENTLEFLWLDYIYSDLWLGGLDDISPIESLENFKKLRYVKAAMLFFFGGDPTDRDTLYGNDLEETADHCPLVNMFPPTVEVLYFTHCFHYLPYLITEVEELLMQKDRRTPRLRSVTIEVPSYVGHFYRRMFDSSSLEPLAHAAGVTVRVVKAAAEPAKYSSRSWNMDDSESSALWETVLKTENEWCRRRSVPARESRLVGIVHTLEDRSSQYS